MTNEEKLEYIKSQLNAYISNINTMAKMKTFLQSTYQQKINALKGRIQKDIDTHSGHAVDEQARVDELTIFKDDLNSL